MFGLFSGKKKDLFEERRKKQEVWLTIRRITDRKIARESVLEEDNRRESRLSMVLPAIMFSLDTPDAPLINCLVKDIADNGLGLTCRQAVENGRVFFALWVEQPHCFEGTVCRCSHLGADYWDVGIELDQVTTLGSYEQFREHVKALQPMHV